MIISCPACSTRYSVNPASLNEGKTVRCAKCGEKWFQAADEEAPAPAPQPAPDPKPEPESEPEPDSVEEPSTDAAEEPAAEAQSSDAEADDAPKDGGGDEEKEESSDEPLSQDDLDNLFDEPAEGAATDTEEPAEEPAEDVAKADGKEGEAGEEVEEAAAEPSEGQPPDEVEVPKDLPDAEPIPEVFTTGIFVDEEKARFGAGKIAAGIAAVLVIGLVAGGLFGRTRIVAMWPQAEPFYAMVGLSGEVLGGGLDIRGVKWERTVERGAPLLVIGGIIANVGERSRPVPWIQVTLFDASNEEIQRLIFPPEQDEMSPGKTMPFKARVKNPPVTARRLEVTFTDEKKM